MSGPHDLVPAAIASAFVFGMLLALLGSIKLPLARRLALDETRVGALLAALNLALIPMVLVSGVVVDRIGVRGVVIAGSALAAIGLVGLAFAESYRIALASLFAAGLGGSCLTAGAMVLMPRAFFEDNASASLNLGNVFFGLGALATPALADVLVRGLGLRAALGVLAAVALAPAAAAAAVPADAYDPGTALPGRLLGVFNTPAVWLAALVLVLYCPLEGALGTWATTYLTEFGYRARRAALLLSGFWLAFLAGRLVVGYLQQRETLPRNSDAWLIVLLALAAGVVLGNLAGTRNASVASRGLLTVGALLGPIFPTLVGVVFDNTDPGSRGSAFGTMFAIGSAGSLVLPPAVGAFARRTSVRAAFRIPTMMALALSGLALLLALSVG